MVRRLRFPYTFFVFYFISFALTAQDIGFGFGDLQEDGSIKDVSSRDTKWEDDNQFYAVIETESGTIALKEDEYYSRWNTQKLNPYNIAASSLNEKVVLNLYDPYFNNASLPLGEHIITSSFGLRNNRYHYGTDLRLNVGDTVRSVFDGIVRLVKFDKNGYGNYVVIRHSNGLETLYAHLKKPLVDTGNYVKSGETVGLGGNTGRSTGPHLHFETRYQGNPFNAAHVFDFKKNTVKNPQFELLPAYFTYAKTTRKTVAKANTTDNSEKTSGQPESIVKFHLVRHKDTLASISSRYGVTVKKIKSLNGLKNNKDLIPGRRIRVY